MMKHLKLISSVKNAILDLQIERFTQTSSRLASTSEHRAPKPSSGIPGPRIYPVIGNLPLIFQKDWNLNRLDKIHKKLFETYGQIYTLKLPFRPQFVFVSDPKDIEKLFRATMSNPIRPAFDSIAQVRTKELNYYFEKKPGLVVTNEEEWRRIRFEVQNPILKVKNVQTFIPQMEQVSKDFIARIEFIKDEKNEVGEDFLDEIYKWGLESVATITLNSQLGCLQNDLAPDSVPMKMINAVKDSLTALNKLEFGLPIWKIFPTKEYKVLLNTTKLFFEAAEEKIQVCMEDLKKKSPEENHTLLEILLQNPKLSYKDVVTLIIDMLIAGIDTTANTVAFTLFTLSRNPECQRLLQKEIDDVIGDPQQPITPEILAKMRYLKAVVKETFRFFPLVFGVARQLSTDLELSGYLIPKGWGVITLNLFSGHDEAFFPQANKFIPERWLAHKPLGPINPFVVLPFSHGPRMCLGRRIAEQELYIVLIKIFQKYNVDYHYKDMELHTRLVFQPSEPCRFQFIERNSI